MRAAVYEYESGLRCEPWREAREDWIGSRFRMVRDASIVSPSLSLTPDAKYCLRMRPMRYLPLSLPLTHHMNIAF